MSEDKDYIVKKVLYAGTAPVPFKDGTKVIYPLTLNNPFLICSPFQVYFHFQTKLCDKDETVIDDSRKMGKGEPLHIVLGKKFKLEVWEAIIQKMALREVAQFRVDKSVSVLGRF